jgi:methyl coenzyme M reductase gamma subunit
MIFYLVFFSLLKFDNSVVNDLHPIHISRSEVNYDKEGKSLQITLHLFIDDLEDAMVLAGMPNPKISAKSELKNAEQLIFNYLKERFVFFDAKGNTLSLNWIGRELGDSPLAMICYLEIENLSNITNLSVKNDINMDLHDDQVNIIETFIENRPKSAFHLKKKGQVRNLEF